MSTNQEAASLEQTLEKTGFGHMINENKKLIMVLSAIVIALILGYSVYEQMNASKVQQRLDDLFKIETTVFDAYVKGDTKEQEFKNALSSMNSDYIGRAVLIPPFLSAINKLDTENAVDASVLETVDKWLSKLHKTDYLYLFMALRAASLYEDHGNAIKSIELLNGLTGLKSDLLKDKIYFELGRLYAAQNNTAQAKLKFDFLVKNYADSDYTKLAQIYMSGL